MPHTPGHPRTRRTRKLRAALAWLIFGALAPLLLTSSFFLARQWDLQREASLNRLRDLSLALQLAVDRELAVDQTALQVLATSAAIDAQNWPAFYTAASEAAKVRAGTWVLLGDRDGRTIINTLVPFGNALPGFGDDGSAAPAQFEWKGRMLPWFDKGVLSEPLRTGEPRVSSLFYGPVRQGPVVALSVPVKRNDAVPYALAFAYSPERFVNVIRQQPGSETMAMSIIDGNGTVVFRSRDTEQAIGRAAPWSFVRRSDTAPEGVVEAHTFDGVPAFIAHRHSDVSDWTVVVTLPRDEVLAPARRSLFVWLGLLLAMVAAAALLARRFWRRVAIPLMALADQARQLGDRDIDPPANDIEEIATLYTALKDMARAERARRDEVSRRLELEQSARRLASQHAAELSAADRRKDEFLAVLAHELRSPLAPIANAVEVMRRVAPAEPAVQRVLPILDRQTRQLARLVEDILDLARINRGKIVLARQRLDLREVLDHAAQAAQAAMDARGHAFTVQLGEEPLGLDGDEARLAQIVGNLLDNAAKYTAPGGRVALTARREGANAIVQVADSGKGITPSLLPHVFDLFEQGDVSGVRAAGGLGIGLHVVKRLVEQHGGEVSVESPGEQRGSVFTVRLPLASSAGRTAAAPAAEAPAAVRP